VVGAVTFFAFIKTLKALLQVGMKFFGVVETAKRKIPDNGSLIWEEA
jgi:hypothetical protein